MIIRSRKWKSIYDDFTELPYTRHNIEKYKSHDNLLKHAKYTVGISSGVFLVDRNDELVGYIGWEGSEIISLEVSKNYRGLGIGKYLIQRAIDAGCNSLYVTSSNKSAISLYESMGFRKIEESNRKSWNRIKMVRDDTN